MIQVLTDHGCFQHYLYPLYNTLQETEESYRGFYKLVDDILSVEEDEEQFKETRRKNLI